MHAINFCILTFIFLSLHGLKKSNLFIYLVNNIVLFFIYIDIDRLISYRV